MKCQVAGRLPINTQVRAHNDVGRPEFGSDGQFRIRQQTLIPGIEG
jgi:hypothetical protein